MNANQLHPHLQQSDFLVDLVCLAGTGPLWSFATNVGGTAMGRGSQQRRISVPCCAKRLFIRLPFTGIKGTVSIMAVRSVGRWLQLDQDGYQT